jgi:AraC-like DNA-binding protein
MKYELENILVDCLRGTLNVLFCGDAAASNQSVERQIRRLSIYNLFVANSSSRADQLARQVQSWNVMVVGADCSFDEECLALAAEHPRWVPVIQLIDPHSPRMPYHSSDTIPASSDKSEEAKPANGSTHPHCMITTCAVDNPRKLSSLIQMKAIQNRLLAGMPTGMVRLAMEVLFRENPLTVDEWCTTMGISPRKFQREFKRFTSLTPKKIVALYHAYRIAFDALDGRKQAQAGIIPAYVMDSQSRNRVMEYVLTRRSSLISSVG